MDTNKIELLKSKNYEVDSVEKLLELTTEEVEEITARILKKEKLERLLLMIDEARLKWTLDNLMES